ncbi:EAL domain-containing protein [Aestuariibacter sp. A3R04]|uniref:EAL domain-containing protein n=1 Tax=Aestuariibacter sp. A3R04 TaxID=2841571 RepID=UPI001C09EC54|nr:EAL domain-containing protein [Aestuariibacter sp. A3R04]MBU3023207.1 EAL domain-containing protein [Aestuariibacter sp. A3R04]
MRVKSVVPWRFYGFFSTIFLSFAVYFPVLGEPIISHPSFLKLDSSDGLAQENVRDIVRDRDGFIWIATEGGLSRFDGYRFVTVSGPDNVFVNNTVTKLFVDSDNGLWISTYNEGIYRFDLNNNQFQLIARERYKDQPEWIQSGDAFSELPDGDILIALEQKILRVKGKTGSVETLYTLDEELLEDNQIVRDILPVGEHLIIATSSDVFLRPLNDNNAAPLTLDYLAGDKKNKLNGNAKVLHLLSSNQLLVGTVGGLYLITFDQPLSETTAISYRSERILADRNVWTIRTGKNNHYWAGTDQGLFCITREQGRIKTEHMLYPILETMELADKSIRTILPDMSGNLWLGSEAGGVLYWYAQPLGVVTIQNQKGEAVKPLANNVVLSLYQSSPDTLWVGTNAGLTRYDLIREQGIHWGGDMPAGSESGVSSVHAIHPADERHLIVESYEGLRLFNTTSGEFTPLPASTTLAEKVFSDWNYGSATDSQGRVYFIADDFYRYDYRQDLLEVIPLAELGYSAQFASGFIKSIARYPNEIFLALRNGLLLVNTDDFSVRTVFKYSEIQRNFQRSVTSVTADMTDTLWLGFPSNGLMALDAKTFSPKQHLTDRNTLRSNVVYNVIRDEEGGVWYSSHGYFSYYSSLNTEIKNYYAGQDIKVSEFNDGAALQLTDGRIAFGSTTGLMIFDPTTLKEETKKRAKNVSEMAISGILLDSRSLDKPMRNLSGEHIRLRHDDYGITIQFAALSSSYRIDSIFKYKLIRGSALVSESVTKNGSVTFAFLSPGEYHFEVLPLKQTTDSVLLPATLSFTIPYPPLQSPLAYSVYVFLCLILIGAYLYHRQRQLKRLHQAQHQVRLFGDAFQHTRDWVMIFDKTLVPVAANPACCAAFGLDRRRPLDKQLNRLFENAPVLGKTLKDKLVSLRSGEFWKSEEKLRGGDGQQFDVLLEVSATGATDSDAEPDHYLLVMSDITEQKNAERKLIKVANYDALTGLVNRNLLLERLELAIETAGDNLVAVLFVDLDRFKGINDSLGHDYGDKLLRIIANRMLNIASDNDTVSRLGGDEFVIVMEDVTSKEQVGELVTSLIQSLETPISLGEDVVRVSASIGISFYPDNGVEPSELLKQSDVAMYTAKKNTVHGFSYYTQDMNDRVRERLMLENRVKLAYQESRFFNHYQPIVNAKTNKTVGVELLLRCSLADPPLYPSAFIPILEELRYVIEVTRHAMRRAVDDLKTWYSQGFDGYLSVNLSALHFKTEFDIAGTVALLENAGLPPSALRFELTESILMDDTDGALRQVEQFIDAGFKLALDDFGTGYSSLSYLKKFPLHVLKIDKSFVDDIQPGHEKDALVLTTISLAVSLHMQCVAEGVETGEQASYLLDKGCVYQQGYFYSRPVPASQVPALLQTTWPAP